MNLVHTLQDISRAVASAALVSALLVVSYLAFEPAVGHAIYSGFLVEQTVTSEISFLTPATDVTMNGALNGLTGGTATGATYAVVSTNSTGGYEMTLDFASSSYGTAAMNLNGGGGDIEDYVTAGNNSVADYSFDTGEAFAQFGFTVSASTTGDLDPTFTDDGAGNCDGSGADTDGSDTCWMSPSSTAITIIDRGTGTPSSGSTSTIYFQVTIPNNPSPSVPNGTYTATATLTALAT